MTREQWIVRKANAAARRAGVQVVARNALAQSKARVANAKGKANPRQTPSVPAAPRKTAPVCSRGPIASPELAPSARREDLEEYRRSVFGSTDDAEIEPVAPVEPIVAPPPPGVYKRIWEYEGRFYEDAQLRHETSDVEKYVCSRGLCYRTKVHRIEVELVLVPQYPRNTIGVEYELDDCGMWRPKAGQAGIIRPYANTR
jgi:hypothetical protein